MIEFYFTLDPTKNTVNGNIAFLPFVVLIPFLLLSLFITWTVGRKYFAIKPLNKPWLFIFVLALILLISIPGEYQLIQKSIDALHGSWQNPQSIIYKKGAVNSYTNSLYFNENTFLFLHLFAFLSGFFGRKDEWQLEDTNDEEKQKNQEKEQR